MTSHASTWLARTALGAAMLALAAAHSPALATPEFRIPVVVCVPANPQSMANELKLTIAGVARQAGRNPPPRAYFCPVFNPDFTTPFPTWRHLRLVYDDSTGLSRNITVRLYEKGAGGNAEIASISSVAAAGLNTVSGLIRGQLDFSRNSYYITVDMMRPAFVTPDVVDVHEVRLTH